MRFKLSTRAVFNESYSIVSINCERDVGLRILVTVLMPYCAV